MVENDDRLYDLKDCLRISSETEIPVLFDVFYHVFNNSNETTTEAFELFHSTWKAQEGVSMVGYSTPEIGEPESIHTKSINLKHFRRFLSETSLLILT